MEKKDSDAENRAAALEDLEVQNIEELITKGKTKKKMDPRKKKKIIKRSILLGVIVIIVGFFIVSKVMSKNAGTMVTVVPVTKGDIDSTLDTSGTVKSEDSRTYFASAVTNIGTVDVSVGEVVTKGQTLATYDLVDLEAATKKEILQAQASAYEYQGTADEHAKAIQELSSAVTEITDYQIKIAACDAYIKQLEDSINDEIVKKRTDLQTRSYNLQRSSNNYSYQMNLPDTTMETRAALQKASLDISNEQAKISNDLAGLSDYKTKDKREDELLVAKKNASDLKYAYDEARGKQSKSEGAIQNSSRLKAAELNSEATQAVGTKAEMTLEIAKKGIVADFAGVVTSVDVVAGTPVVVGGKLLTIESNENVKVEIAASKYDLETLKLGQKATLTISGIEYEGTVSKINHVAVPNASGTPMVTVEVHVDNSDENIYLGIEAKVSIHTADAQGVLLAPLEAVNADNAGDFCYIVKDGVVARKPVKVGISSATSVEIKEGLAEGDQLITALPIGLAEGSKVTVMPVDAGITTESTTASGQ
ncbi:MAG: efflux RND transporter periplasmic adaptor subunit [Lachnospiraceae bacterium]